MFFSSLYFPDILFAVESCQFSRCEILYTYLVTHCYFPFFFFTEKRFISTHFTFLCTFLLYRCRDKEKINANSFFSLQNIWEDVWGKSDYVQSVLVWTKYNTKSNMQRLAIQIAQKYIFIFVEYTVHSRFFLSSRYSFIVDEH